jgi:hypothetical protein
MMRETLGVNNENVWEDMVSKREKEKLHKVSHTFSHSFWNVFKFVEKVQLGNKGLNLQVCKAITASLVSHNEITYVWCKATQCLENKHLWIFEAFLKLYEDVYTHPPPNGAYPSVFLHGWLTQQKGLQVN